MRRRVRNRRAPAGSILFGFGCYQTAEIGRLLQGAGAAFAFTGAVYLTSHGFSAAYLATAIGFTQMFGMLGGLGRPVRGQSAHPWIDPPAGHDTPVASSNGSWLSIFKPYKVVLSNPQSYLCGLTAGLLFLPTTIGDMIWGVPFLRNGMGVAYSQAVDRATMVPLGWVIGCPLLGYLADRIGRRKPVLIGGALLMLAATVTFVYLPGVMPPYLLGLLIGIGSGAAMILYSIIKEVNPDDVKGSATGAINFLVFTLSALLAPAYGWLLNSLAGGGKLTLGVFQHASGVGIVLALFLRETRHGRHPTAPVLSVKVIP